MQNNTNNVDLNTALDKFKTALEELQNLKNQKNINIVDATGIGRQEVKHSHFLAWLLSPNEPHKLDNNVLIGLCEKLYDYKTNGDQYTPIPSQNKYIIDKGLVINSKSEFLDLLSSQTGYTVETEHPTAKYKINKGRIDILVDIKDADTVIVIENKIDSTTHDDQLLKYYEYICKNSRFKHYGNKIFIYLTPKGELPRDDNKEYKDEWCVFDYYQIISLYREIINNHFKQAKLSDYDLRLKFLLEDFINMYNDILGQNKTLRSECEKILNNKGLAEVLELLNTYKDKYARRESVIEYCRNWLENNWKNYSKSELIIRKAKKSLSCYTQDMLDHLNDISGNLYGDKFSTRKWRCYIGTEGGEDAPIHGIIQIVRNKDIDWDCAQYEYFQKYPNDVNNVPWVKDPMNKEEWRQIFQGIVFWEPDDADYTLDSKYITDKLDDALEGFCDNLKKFEEQILSL